VLEQGLDSFPVETAVQLPDLLERRIVTAHGTIVRYWITRVKMVWVARARG
jgi:hypothetical protein